MPTYCSYSWTVLAPRDNGRPNVLQNWQSGTPRLAQVLDFLRSLAEGAVSHRGKHIELPVHLAWFWRCALRHSSFNFP